MNDGPCLVPARSFAPVSGVPVGAIDTHAHVIGPRSSYPMAPVRAYDPPESAEADYTAMLAATGMARGVIVSASVYGTDNRCTMDAVQQDPTNRRAIVVLDADVPEDEIARLDALGARGFRINTLFAGGTLFDALERLAAKAAPFGWHVQLLIDITMLAEVEHQLRALPIDCVIDHMGHFDAARGTDWDGFRRMVGLAEDGRSHIKLSGLYRLDTEPPYERAEPIAKKLIEAVPDRLVWGSDWPHVAQYRHMPDPARLLDQILRLIPDPDLRRKILVETAEALYGFPTSR
ncbi:MAG: amidohydrolase family protein [Pseudomonadota bacterium]